MYKKKPESFGSLLFRKRQEWELNLEQLSEGLCTPSTLARIEKGERTPDKLLRDRLLLRVGISPDTYESFLFGDDFAPWKLRQQIANAVAKRQNEQARLLLSDYHRLYVQATAETETVYERLEQQFCQSMEAQLLRYEGAADKKLAELFGKALTQTVPRIDESVRGRALCIQELNLFLEYIRHRHPSDAARRYLDILEYIKHSQLDDVSRARIYPKAIVYFYTYGMEPPSSMPKMADYSQAIRLCQAGIELLQQTGRMYHLWELLTLYETFLNALAASHVPKAPARAAALQPLLAQNEERLHALEVTYTQYGVPKETEDFCYLYIEKEVYCIGDVIRLRRTMLGLNRAQLCEGICSERTLLRLELNQKRTYWYNVRQLFERLKLAPEYCRTALVTDNPEAIDCLDKARKCIPNQDCEKADTLIQRIEELVDMSLPSNQQVVLRHRALNELEKGTITKKEFRLKVAEALEYTLPYQIAMAPGRKYLTNEEMLCIQNIATETEEHKKEYIHMFCEIYQPYADEGIVNCYINMYETIMGYVMSELGNIGEYKHSDKISCTLVTECLYMRRLYGVYKSIYNILWNEDQQLKKGILSKRKCNPVKDLQCCIVFSEFCHKSYRARFYKKKLASREKA